MSNQAIVRNTQVSVVTFTGKPSEQTREALQKAGYEFNGFSKQWVRKEESATVETEESVARTMAA